MKFTKPQTLVRELPADYSVFLEDVKARIQAARIKAALAANRELVQLYWDFGKRIVEKQRAEGWGKAIVERLASDIQRAFPGIAGFSARNVWRMRAFYLVWTGSADGLPQPVADFTGQDLPQAVAELPWGMRPVACRSRNAEAATLAAKIQQNFERLGI